MQPTQSAQSAHWGTPSYIVGDNNTATPKVTVGSEPTTPYHLFGGVPNVHVGVGANKTAMGHQHQQQLSPARAQTPTYLSNNNNNTTNTFSAIPDPQQQFWVHNHHNNNTFSTTPVVFPTGGAPPAFASAVGVSGSYTQHYPQHQQQHQHHSMAQTGYAFPGGQQHQQHQPSFQPLTSFIQNEEICDLNRFGPNNSASLASTPYSILFGGSAGHNNNQLQQLHHQQSSLSSQRPSVDFVGAERLMSHRSSGDASTANHPISRGSVVHVGNKDDMNSNTPSLYSPTIGSAKMSPSAAAHQQVRFQNTPASTVTASTPSRIPIFVLPKSFSKANSNSASGIFGDVLEDSHGKSSNGFGHSSIPIVSNFEEDGLPPMIDPSALEAVNKVLKESACKEVGSPISSVDVLTQCAPRPRVTKRYATTCLGLPLLSPHGASPLIPVQTLRFYSPDFSVLFEAPLHNIHPTQGLIQFMTRVNKQGFPAPQPPIIICKHVFDTVFKPFLEKCNNTSSLDQSVEDLSPASFLTCRRTEKNCQEWLARTDRVSTNEELPEEVTPGFPAVPTTWAPPAQEQPASVYSYGRALSTLYGFINRAGWCPLGSKCPHVHPFCAPASTISTEVLTAGAGVSSPGSNSPVKEGGEAKVASTSDVPQVPHPTITWSSVHTTEHAPEVHLRFAPGFTFSVAPPNDIAACKSIQSESVFITRGVLEFYKFVCLAMNKDIPPLPPQAMELVSADGTEILEPRSKLIANRIVGTNNGEDSESQEERPEKQQTTVLQHCAHYSKSGVCALGPDCLFVHVVGHGNRMHPRPEDLCVTANNNNNNNNNNASTSSGHHASGVNNSNKARRGSAQQQPRTSSYGDHHQQQLPRNNAHLWAPTSLLPPPPPHQFMVAPTPPPQQFMNYMHNSTGFFIGGGGGHPQMTPQQQYMPQQQYPQYHQ